MDIYAHVTDKIVAMIERGFDGEKFGPLWGASAGMPVSAGTGKPYRGINTVLLWCASREMGYQSSTWATYRAWRERGAQVTKGQKSTTIVFWRQLEARGDAGDGEDAADDRPGRARMMARAYAVFNADQVEGWTEPAQPQLLSPDQRIEAADLFLRNTGAKVLHGGDQAYFVPSQDYIQMPPFQCFRDGESYYAVALHELTHWSGHASRLNRVFGERFKSQERAIEELVAEIGSAFLLASIGLTPEPRPDHAHYVHGWLRLLKNDKRAVFTAAAAAQRAADLLWSFQPAVARADLPDSYAAQPIS